MFSPPFSNGEPASLLIGQPTYASGGCGIGFSSSYLCDPVGVAFDKSSNLWTLESYSAGEGNNRVLMFSRFANGELASRVLGQSSFSTSTCATTQSGLCSPNGITLDKKGNMWVVDETNSRVLRYNAPLATGKAASLVIGQASFTSNNCTTTQTSSCFPRYAALDSSGNLWVTDFANNRVLEFTVPFTNGEPASLVIGQSSFTMNACHLSKGGLCGPNGLAFDKSGNLWVVDTSNDRVLRFDKPFSIGELASLVIGQTTFTTGTPATTQGGLSVPRGIAFDKSGNLWIADLGNWRTLEFSPPFSNGELASIVIGQSSFTSSTCAATQVNTCGTTALGFDATGNLWVADAGNNRVLKFIAPFNNGEFAWVVIGQPDFTHGSCATTQSGLCVPEGIAFDKSGNLWVSESNNRRVMEFT